MTAKSEEAGTGFNITFKELVAAVKSTIVPAGFAALLGFLGSLFSQKAEIYSQQIEISGQNYLMLNISNYTLGELENIKLYIKTGGPMSDVIASGFERVNLKKIEVGYEIEISGIPSRAVSLIRLKTEKLSNEDIHIK